MPDGGGESLVTLRERIACTVDEIAARHRGQQVVLVAHGGVGWTCCTAWPRLGPAGAAHLAATNAAINRLLWTGGNGPTLVGWADTQHLEQHSRDEISLPDALV